MSETYHFRPIGIVNSPHLEAAKTPIQPVFAADVQATVVLDPQYVEGLVDLEGFSHIYLFYAFHRATETHLTVKPFLEDIPHGVFATRAPCRPNKLGFSIVRLLSIEDNILHITEVDILDGTPILDIKPFVARFDQRDNVRSGWTERVPGEEAAKRGRRGFPDTKIS